MDTAIDTFPAHAFTATGAAGNRIVGDAWPASGAMRGHVILAHGGGQTRHSWAGAAQLLARHGFAALSYDQRGHGDSEWVSDGDYSFAAFADDLVCLAQQRMQEFGGDKPIVIGASLGGIAGMIAAGQCADAPLRALVLVDVTPHLRPDGVERILRFMAARASDGFATLEEAAETIAAYLPHRPRPKDLSGLSKNLRRGEDGRYRWHWDPRFLHMRRDARAHGQEIEAQLQAAVAAIDIPLLLVRGRESELVGEEEAAAFLKLAPHARLADVSGARHMVAGDRNDVFAEAVLEFLDQL